MLWLCFRFIFFCLRRHRGSSPQERNRVSPAKPCEPLRQIAGSWRRLGEHCQRNINKNKHRLNTSTFHIVARCTLEETGSVRALLQTKRLKEQVIVGGSFSRLEVSLAKPLKLFEDRKSGIKNLTYLEKGIGCLIISHFPQVISRT